MKWITLLLVALFTASLVGCAAPKSSVVAPPDLADKLDAILTRNASSGAIVSARVIDTASGIELYARDIDRPMMPASNMKLPTSAAAVDRFGPDHAFETRAFLAGRDFWLVGRGDTAWGDPLIAERRGSTIHDDIDRWIAELRAAGVTSLDRIVYDGNFFDTNEMVHASWGRDDLPYWYAAPVSGLNFNNNCVEIAADIQDGRVVFTAEPATTQTIEIVNELTIGEAGAENTADIERDVDRNRYVAQGVLTKRTQFRSRPVTDPAAFAADVVATRLRAAGIAVGSIERHDAGAPMPRATLRLTPAKTTLAEVMPRVNKNSQNLLTEGLAKSLGATITRGQPATWADGEIVIRAFLRRNRIDDRGFELADGSGLSRGNRVTVRLISDLLQVMHRHRHQQTFFDSLAVGGVDGTIASRFKDHPNRVFAKTGFIGGVRSLSGYAKTDSGKWVTFSIIYNQIPGSVAPFNQMQDDAVRLLMTELR
jgi:D-alanyl-D-alanine carboxypeptidase/D-alanyl-D-alanine-endopeptidase (penicillin-binding protein 4)